MRKGVDFSGKNEVYITKEKRVDHFTLLSSYF